MSINLVRIDDRLIHGQVVEGWLKVIKASVILIISDRLAGKQDESVLFSLAVPEGIAVDCLCVDEASERLNNNYYKSQELLILSESPHEILAVLEKGVKIQSVNVGGLHFSPGKISINDSLYVDECDCRIFNKIASFKVVIEGRALPGDKKLDVVSELKKLKICGS